MKEFYVYVHMKPDLTPFYVGKGTGKRAWNLTHRNPWHGSIVKKYGAKNILVEVQACRTEEEAFFRERAAIGALRANGGALCNVTDGGEGTSGWHHSLETKLKIRTANSGRRNAAFNNARHVTPHTEATKKVLKAKTELQFQDSLARLAHSLRIQELWKTAAYQESMKRGNAKRDYEECRRAMHAINLRRKEDPVAQEKYLRALRQACSDPEKARKHAENMRGRIWVHLPTTGASKLVARVDVETLYAVGWKVGRKSF